MTKNHQNTDKKNDKDWLDTVADFAAMLGFNRIQIRWKLDRLRRSLSHTAEQTKGKVSHIGYANKVCPNCHSVNDAEAKVCARCEHPLTGRFFQVLSRIGILSPQFANVSTVIVAAIMLIYARMVMDMGGGFQNLLSIDTATLFKFGASYAGAYHNGEWYRLLTSVLLHAGLWHIGFNLLALSQLGPFVEEIFGKARMLIYFVLTGIFASMGSLLVRGAMARASGNFTDMSVAIGASGAIMGLMGIMAGWGHRDGTGIGRHARNTALKWALYTIVFGFIIDADNGAHVSGFVLGGIIGLVVNPLKIKRPAPSPTIIVLSLIAAIMLTAATAACVIPVTSPLTETVTKRMRPSPYDEKTSPTRIMNDLCAPLRAGDKALSKQIFLAVFSPNIFMTDAEIEGVMHKLCADISPNVGVPGAS